MHVHFVLAAVCYVIHTCTLCMLCCIPIVKQTDLNLGFFQSSVHLNKHFQMLKCKVPLALCTYYAIMKLLSKYAPNRRIGLNKRNGF